MNHVEYRIQTWHSDWNQKWDYAIKKYRRVSFKRKGGIGWTFIGFIERRYPLGGFDTRAEALAHARSVRAELLK